MERNNRKEKPSSVLGKQAWRVQTWRVEAVFQVRVAATEKAQSSTVDSRVRWTVSDDEEVEPVSVSIKSLIARFANTESQPVSKLTKIFETLFTNKRKNCTYNYFSSLLTKISLLLPILRQNFCYQNALTPLLNQLYCTKWLSAFHTFMFATCGFWLTLLALSRFLSFLRETEYSSSELASSLSTSSLSYTNKQTKEWALTVYYTFKFSF